MAGVERLELSRTVLETVMLPLHHTPIFFLTKIIITHRALIVNKNLRKLNSYFYVGYCINL